MLQDSFPSPPSPGFAAGTRVTLSGGYYMRPTWLGGRLGVRGVIERFIPGQNDQPAAVVRLEESLSAEGVTGWVVVLELRYTGATWQCEEATVHMELCDFDPDAKTWKDRRQGKWVESHASVRISVPD